MKLLWVLCAILAFGVSGFAVDREAFTFTNYDLDVRIEPEQQRLGVRGKITLRNDSDVPQKSFCLQISSSLNWSSIQLGGKPAEFLSQIYTSDIDHTGALTEAIVTIPQPLAPRQSVELEIGYEGIIPQDATRLTRIGVPNEVAKHSDWDQIGRSFTAVRGIGYVAWYPVATAAASLSDGNTVFEAVGRWKQREAEAKLAIRFSHSGEAVSDLPAVLCNGPGQPGGYEQMSRAYHAWNQCTYSTLGSLVPLFVIGNYGAVDRPAVNIRYLPDHKSGAEDYVLAVEQTSPLASKWFGDHREKPETKAEVVELPDLGSPPFESGNMLLMPLTGKDTALLLSAIHQLTHVAFPSPRSWIYQGLAAYAQVRYVQEEEGRQAAIEYLLHHRDALAQIAKIHGDDSNNAAAHSLINSPDEFYVQSKATNVWWMLRDMVGEDGLTAALHNYKAADDKDASYMQKLIEAQAHRDLEWFFDDWVYRDRGLPDFRVVYVYPRKLLNGGYMVTITIENLGNAGAEVPVTLHLEKGEASERLVVPGKSKATVRIQAVSLPLEVTVNDGSVPESDTTNNAYKVESAPQAQ